MPGLVVRPACSPDSAAHCWPGSSSKLAGAASTKRRQPVQRHGRLAPVSRPGAGRLASGTGAHHHFFASSRASKTASGITAARLVLAPPLIGGSGSSPSWRAAAAWLRPWHGCARRPAWPGAAAFGPVLPALPRPLFGLVQQGLDGLGDLGLGGRVLAAAGEDCRGRAPMPARRTAPAPCAGASRHRDPAAVQVVADPDPGDVVRVVVDLPQALLRGDPGRLAAVGGQRLAVVGAVADLDAVGVDRPPGRRQQLDVVARRPAGPGRSRLSRPARRTARSVSAPCRASAGARSPSCGRFCQSATIHSSSRSCSSAIDQTASSSAFLPRCSTLRPA